MLVFRQSIWLALTKPFVNLILHLHVNISNGTSICQSRNQSIHLHISICPSYNNLSIFKQNYLSIIFIWIMSIYPPINQSHNLQSYFSFQKSIFPSIHQWVHLIVNISIYKSISPSTKQFIFPKINVSYKWISPPTNHSTNQSIHL